MSHLLSDIREGIGNWFVRESKGETMTDTKSQTNEVVTTNNRAAPLSVANFIVAILAIITTLGTVFYTFGQTNARIENLQRTVDEIRTDNKTFSADINKTLQSLHQQLGVVQGRLESKR